LSSERSDVWQSRHGLGFVQTLAGSPAGYHSLARSIHSKFTWCQILQSAYESIWSISNKRSSDMESMYKCRTLVEPLFSAATNLLGFDRHSSYSASRAGM
jgi:hypothetical protein